MPKVLSDETIRRRDVRLKMEWDDIEGLISFAAMEQIGAPSGARVGVKLSQSEEGSPSYRIGEWTAIVEVTFPVD
jgi:hypothetical protein